MTNEGIDYVVCQVCGRNDLKQTTYTHLKKHDLTVKEYKDTFPGHPLTCEKTREKRNKNISNRNRQMWADPNSIFNTLEYREQMSQRSNQMWMDLDSKVNTPEYREKKSKNMKQARADPNSKYNKPERRERLSRSMKNARADPNSTFNTSEYREKQEKTRATPEFREKMSKIVTDARADPNSTFNTPECREKTSESIKRLWADPDSIFNTPEFHEKMRIIAINRKQSNKDTRIEILLFHGLLVRGFRYGIDFLHNENVANVCNADFIFPIQKLVIETDGCFYHACPIHKPAEAMNPNNPKEKNAMETPKRDKQKTEILEQLGYTVLHFWEHEINQKYYPEADLEAVLDRIEEASNNILNKGGDYLTQS